MGNPTQYYVDPAINANSGAGTIGSPYGDLQYALNTIGTSFGRNAADGDQINIKAGAAEVNVTSLTLATFGTPNASSPLILRGYTAVANDGGVAEINCNGVTMWFTAYSGIILIDLQIHTGGISTSINLGQDGRIFRCHVHRGASGPASTIYLVTLGVKGLIIGSFLDCGGIRGVNVTTSAGCVIAANFIRNTETAASCGNVLGLVVCWNIITVSTLVGTGVLIAGTAGASIFNNSIYHTGGGTGMGINVGSSTARYSTWVANNVIEGFSGVGGSAIGGFIASILGPNVYYNNTTNISVSDSAFIDLTAGDTVLAASPFADPANGNFAASPALKETGWPTSFLGSITNQYLDAGAVQRQEALGRRAMRVIG